tara:strand:- start:223 stop:1179 length:957 start_codon:yes stop_codon:yes gene_type:complete
MISKSIKQSFLYNCLRSFYVLVSFSLGSYIRIKFGNRNAEADKYNHDFSSIKSVFYWVYYLNYISLFKNINNSRKLEYFNEYSLNLDGFARIKDLDKDFLENLKTFYLEKVKFDGALDEYFDALAKQGDVRPEGLNLLEYPDTLSQLLQRSSILPIVEQHLGIPFEDIHIYGKVDTLVKLTSERLAKAHDDALVFHRDHDSCKAVKVFFYLNDVEEGCGHHEIYLGSHRDLPLRLRPIRRYQKNEIEEHINPSSLKRVVGKAGYGFIENTTCFHRGTVPTKGNRIIISLSFNDTKSIKRLQREKVGDEILYAPLTNFC